MCLYFEAMWISSKTEQITEPYLESVKMAEINKRANYHLPAGKKHGTVFSGGTNTSQCICLNTRIRAFPYRN